MNSLRLRPILLLVALMALLLVTLAFGQADAARSHSSADAAPLTEDAEEWLSIIKAPNPAGSDTLYVSRGDNARFTIVVTNTNEAQAMVDIVVEDALTPDCDRTFDILSPNTSANYSCKQNNVQESFTNTAVVTGINQATSQENTASDSATVEVAEIEASLTPDPAELLAPGGMITFIVSILNSGSVDVQLTSLTSDVLGDLANPLNSTLLNNTCASESGLPILEAGVGQLQCEFDVDYSGQPGEHVFDIAADGHVTASPGIIVTAADSEVVTLFEAFAASLAAEDERITSGRIVDLTSTVTNLHSAANLSVLSLEDTILGDVRNHGDCSLPQILAPGDTYSCEYKRKAEGDFGKLQTFAVNVTAQLATEPPADLQYQATTSIMVLEPIVHLPLIGNIPPPRTCGNSLPIKVNRDYQFFHDSKFAYYVFELEAPAEVTVELTAFDTNDGQITVYRDLGAGCSDLLRVGHNGKVASEMPVPIGLQQPGRFHVRIVNAGELKEDVAYNLRVRAE